MGAESSGPTLYRHSPLSDDHTGMLLKETNQGSVERNQELKHFFFESLNRIRARVSASARNSYP